MEMLEEHRCFEGWQQRWRHDSSTLNCPMTFSIFLPPPRDHTPPPVLYWLSGLTCNDENFTTKAGAQRVAAELGIVLVMPDTSPRGEQVANDDGYRSLWTKRCRTYAGSLIFPTKEITSIQR